MTQRIDPRIYNTTYDANALDHNNASECEAVQRLLGLADDGNINLIVPQSVRREIEHPNTPLHVQLATFSQIYTLPVQKTEQERKLYEVVSEAVRGNAQAGKHDADAAHLVEAAKYGGGYFITHDGRLLNRRQQLERLLGPSFRIVTLHEFLTLYDDVVTE